MSCCRLPPLDGRDLLSSSMNVDVSDLLPQHSPHRPTTATYFFAWSTILSHPCPISIFNPSGLDSRVRFSSPRMSAITRPARSGTQASANILRLIARCSGVADVIAAVNFGRANNLLTAIRGGGHNVGGRALCDDGLVIDLSRMRSVFVDRCNPESSSTRWSDSW